MLIVENLTLYSWSEWPLIVSVDQKETVGTVQHSGHLHLTIWPIDTNGQPTLATPTHGKSVDCA